MKNMIIVVIQMFLLGLFVCGCDQGDPSADKALADVVLEQQWVKIGNESSGQVDSATGRSVRYLTSGEYVDSLFYPHALTWMQTNRYVLIESSRPRPEGQGETEPGERQILAADIRSGDLFWICTIPVGGDLSKVPSSRQFHADYNEATSTLVFANMAGTRLYQYDMKTGKRRCVYTVSEGAILGDPPTVSEDGQRMGVWGSEPGPHPSDGTYNGRLYAVDMINLSESGEPVVSRMAEVVGKQKLDYRTPDNISHIVISPADRDLCMYKRQGIFLVDADGGNAVKVLDDPQKGWRGHQVWSRDGHYIYLVDSGNIARIDAQTRQYEVLTAGQRLDAWHVSTAKGGRFVAFDRRHKGEDAFGTLPASIWLYDVQTKHAVELARTRFHVKHPRHPHPQLSPCGNWVGFTAAHENGSRIGVIQIEDLVSPL